MWHPVATSLLCFLITLGSLDIFCLRHRRRPIRIGSFHFLNLQTQSVYQFQLSIKPTMQADKAQSDNTMKFTSEIWPQSDIITFQHSIHRFFNQGHIAWVTDTGTMNKKKENVYDRFKYETFLNHTVCQVFCMPSVIQSHSVKIGGASSEPYAYLCARTTATIRESSHTQKDLILLFLDTAILIVIFFFL